MNPTTIAALIVAISALGAMLTSVAALLKQVALKQQVNEIHVNTNSTLTRMALEMASLNRQLVAQASRRAGDLPKPPDGQ
jgi:hypothetical protein